MVVDYGSGTVVCTACGVVNDDLVFGIETTSYEETDVVSTYVQEGTHHKNVICNVKKHATENDIIKNRCYEHLSDSIIHEAQTLFKKFCELKTCRGKIRTGVLACCVFYACKSLHVDRSVEEISQIVKVDTRDIIRAKKTFDVIMKKMIQQKKIDPKTLINRYSNYLAIGSVEKNKVVRNVNKIMEMNLPLFHNKQATSITSIVFIYVLYRMKIAFDKKEFSKKVNVSMVTINKLLSELKSIIGSVDF